MKKLTLLWICLLLAIPCSAEVITVDDDGPADFNNIQAAVDAAGNGDIIIVADGTYASEGWQNNPVIDFSGKAITVRSENGPENCILYRGDHVVRFNSGETQASVLSGFTITGADPGGGIGCYDSSPTIMNNIITGNWSEYGLGAVLLHNSSAIVAGNLIVANDVYGPCAGIYCCHGTAATITNNTIVDNGNRPYYQNGEGAVYCDETSTAVITNCIFWDNNGDYDLYNCSATYSCTEHGEAGIGNIHADPMFANPAGGDYHLQPGSPCIDAGDNSAVLPSMVVDLDGNSRISNGTVDIGAYEFGSAPTPPPSMLFVDASATGANNGSSWVDAFTDLQQALAAATAFSEVEEIRVAQGVYTPAEPSGDRTATFQLINGLTIKGGYAGFGAPDPDARDISTYETILSGDLNGNDVGDLHDESRAENNYHVVTGSGTDANAVLDGFTITAGNAYNDKCSIYDNGGGMYNHSANPTVSNCTFTGNTASDQCGGGGAGMYNYQSSPTVINCTFTANEYIIADDDGGGGMCNYQSNPTLIDCIFTDNVSNGYGGGMLNSNSSPTLTNCTFINNSSAHRGGAMENRYSSPTLTYCTFLNNSTYYTGGAIQNELSSPTLTGCTFNSNSATYTHAMGGGIYNSYMDNPTLINCIFTGNSAKYGGGMYSYWGTATLTNCTFSGNFAAQKGGAMYYRSDSSTLTNCIVWGNTASQGDEIYFEFFENLATMTVNYSDIRGGSAGIQVETGNILNWGSGNINADPLFVDTASGDYHLLHTSPCVNAGDPNFIAEPDQTDIDGHPRVINGRIDMGADEVVIAETKFTPRKLNCDSKGKRVKWVKAHCVLPEGFAVEDVDTTTPAMVEPLGIQSDLIEVFVNENGLVEIVIAFDSAAFCNAIADEDQLVLTVVGSLTDGQYFYGNDTIMIKVN